RVVQGDPGAELAERQEVCVEPPATDLVAARTRQDREAGPRQQGRGQEKRRPDLRRQSRVWARFSQTSRVDRDYMVAAPIDRDSEGADQLDQGRHVSNTWHVLDHHVAGREE